MTNKDYFYFGQPTLCKCSAKGTLQLAVMSEDSEGTSQLTVSEDSEGTSQLTVSEDSDSYESVRPSTEALKANKIVDRIRHQFGSSWRQDDDFLEKFFGVCPTWRPHVEATQKRNYNVKTSRWKRIPKAPNVASKLYTPLRMLMNDILLAEEESRQQPSSHHKSTGRGTTQRAAHRHQWQATHIRSVLATHAKHKRVHTRPRSPVSPSLYLAGTGAQIMGVSSPLIKPNSWAGIAPIEVVLDSDDSEVARDRLATNVSQMFCNQSGRRYAFGLILTETTCTIYMFDHSGAVGSKPFNYHQQPTQLCAIIFGLGSEQRDLLGFDPSIFLGGYRGGLVFCCMVHSAEDSPKPVFYIQDGRVELFHFSTVIGRGTVCWRTRREGHPGSRFVIKDAWIPYEELPGRESEGSLLRHAQEKGVVDGIAQIEHFEELRRNDGSNELDTVLRNRQVNSPTAEDLKLERIHTRIVLRTYGKPLNMFDTRKELLLAFYDAVLGAPLPLNYGLFVINPCP
jgi:Fungal protein kinase